MTNPLCLSFPDGYTFSTIFDSEVVSTIYRIHPWVGRIACVLLVGSIGFAPLLSKNSMLVYYRRQFPLEITSKSHQVLTKTLPNLQKYQTLWVHFVYSKHSCLRGRQVDVVGQQPLRGERFQPQHGAFAGHTRTTGGQGSTIMARSENYLVAQ